MPHYPTNQPCSVPGSGSAFYLYLLKNIKVPSRLPHELWLRGQERFLEDKEHPFRGYYPIDKTYKIAYGTKPMGNYTFTGKEKNPVFVRDLSPETRIELGIQSDAEPKEKVWNPNFLPYDKMPEKAKMSNETVTMSLAKSISSFLGAKDILYSEIDVVEMLAVAMKNAGSQEMRHILHGNHVSWCASRFIETGIMEQDIKREFYGQNTMEFYIRDIGTIMPAILYSFAILGKDPVEMIDFLDYDIWDIKNIATEIQTHMKIYQEMKKVA